MVTVQFSGAVLPRVTQLSLTSTPSLDWQQPDWDISAQISFTIEKSIIHISFVCNKYDQSQFTMFYIKASDLAKTAVELAGFASGYGLSIMLDTFTRPDGTAEPFVISQPSLSAHCTAFALRDGFWEMFRLASSDYAISGLFSDLVASITIPHESTVNCARVVDGIRHLVASGLNTRTQEWSVMRDALRLDRAYVEYITENSKEHRHGKRVPLAGPIVTEIVERSWIIMNRFLEYKKRARGPLPASEFPVLFG